MSHPKIDFTFAAAMRSFPRADPDVIMVGEMREHRPLHFADALLGIMAQRLIRVLCVKCMEGYNPTPEELEEIIEAYGYDYWPGAGITYSPEPLPPPRLPPVQQLLLQREAGRPRAAGRTDEMKKAIQRKPACARYCRTLWKAFKGVTDVKQARAVAVKYGTYGCRHADENSATPPQPRVWVRS